MTMNTYHPYQEAMFRLSIMKGECPPDLLTPEAMSYWIVKYGYNKELVVAQGKVSQKISDLYRVAKKIYSDRPDIKIPFVPIEYLDMANYNGACNPKYPVFIFNPFYLLYDTQYFIEVVVPHEYAHLIDYVDNPEKFMRKDHHDEKFRRITEALIHTKLGPDSQLPPRNSIKRKLEERQTISTDDFIFIQGEGEQHG